MYNRMVNIQWHHNKISPKLSIFTPKFSGEACPQAPLESIAAYFGLSAGWVVPDYVHALWVAVFTCIHVYLPGYL